MIFYPGSEQKSSKYIKLFFAFYRFSKITFALFNWISKKKKVPALSILREVLFVYCLEIKISFPSHFEWFQKGVRREPEYKLNGRFRNLLLTVRAESQARAMTD